MSTSLIARLIAAGTPADLVGEVAMELGAAAAERASLAARRDADRARKAKQRHVLSRDSVGHHVTGVEVTGQGESAPAHPEPTNLPKNLLPKSPPMGGQKGKVPASTTAGDGVAAKPRRGTPRRSQIAPNAQPTSHDHEAAEHAGMSRETFRIEWGLFRDHHLAEASTMANWEAAWRTWVGKWVKWGCKQHGPSTPPPNGGARAGPVDPASFKNPYNRSAARDRQQSNDQQPPRDNIVQHPNAFAPGRGGEASLLDLRAEPFHERQVSLTRRYAER